MPIEFDESDFEARRDLMTIQEADAIKANPERLKNAKEMADRKIAELKKFSTQQERRTPKREAVDFINKAD